MHAAAGRRGAGCEPWSPLSLQCRAALRERAVSASAVLGRRHYETGRQRLGTHEVLAGRRMPAAHMRAAGTGATDRPGQGDAARQAGAGPADRPGQGDAVRQAGAGPTDRPGQGDVARQAGAGHQHKASTRPQLWTAANSSVTIQRSGTVYPDMSIKSLLTNNKTLTATGEGMPERRCASVTEERVSRYEREAIRGKPNGIGRRENNSPLHHHDAAKTNRQRKPVLESQKTTPPCNRSSPSGPCETKRRPTEKKSPSVPPRPPRSHVDEKRHLVGGHRRSSLRALMHSDELDIRHSAGCPYSCRGCFRACLASDEYIHDRRQHEPSAGEKHDGSRMRTSLHPARKRTRFVVHKESLASKPVLGLGV